MQKIFQSLRGYLADFGAVFFVVDAIFIFFALVVEFIYPGFVVNYIAPQTMIMFAVFCGALSILSPPVEKKRSLFLSVVFGASASIVAFFAAQYYFVSITDVGVWLAIMIALTTGIAIFFN